YWNYPPYGLGVLATQLRAADIDVRILNLNNLVLARARAAENEEAFSFTEVIQQALADEIGDFAPDLLGVTCMFAQTHRSMLDVCHLVSDIDAGLAIALGGVHITNSFMEDKTRDALLDDLGVADLLFCYESDISFKTFIAVVNGSADIGELSQMALNGPRPRLHFADKSIPSGDELNVIAAHDLMGTEELSQNGKISGFYSLIPAGTKITTALSNRGCRAQCTFCSVRNFNGLSVRRRSAASVVDEMLMLRDNFGIEHIMWLDDDFLYNRDQSLELFNEMIRRDVGMTWDCTNGIIAASCTEDVARAAAESGCIGLTLGMESGNPEMLKKIRKPGTVKNFLKAAEVLRGIEQINARVFLMIGFPDETYGQIMDTVSVAKEMDLDWYNVTILQPLPNTPIFDAMLEQGLIGDIDFSDIRYNSGQYGKHRKMAEASRDPLSADFKDAFADADMSAVPTRGELDDIWAYLNYHLNFRRLFFEERPG
ncbi:MAG: B12-binding domain-containing radical SAM protein, partial [Alphaproteobacteria bacterium]